MVSEIGGGKFANGAMTAAFQMMYNHMSHPSYDDDGGGSYTAKVLPAAVACCVADGPLHVGDAAAAVMTAGAVFTDAAVLVAATADVVRNYKQRIYVTYVLTNPKTSQVYVGRTSGIGDPLKIAQNRYYHHWFRRSQGYTNLRVDQWSRSYDAIRGREQQLIDFYGGIGSKKLGNYIRGVAKWNPSGRYFHSESNKEFGNIAPYTGY